MPELKERKESGVSVLAASCVDYMAIIRKCRKSTQITEETLSSPRMSTV